ncbi:unnamed protein product [Calicophoron daubneyi]|uniref:Uncharacterized protein n=1 Tax=Calicophoron daubneyi TaxID=300641 RepID=A0AAV2TCG1_CALDB
MSFTSGVFRRSSLPQQSSKSLTATTGPEDSKSSGQNTNKPSPLNLLSSGTGKSKKECFVFEPQQWRKTVCKNCFRTEEEHKQAASAANTNSNSNNNNSTKEGSGVGGGGPAIVLRRSDSAPFPSTPTPYSTQQVPDSGPMFPVKDNQSGGRNTSGQIGSNSARAAARKSAAGQRSGDEHRAQTPYQDARRGGGNGSGNPPPGAGVYSSASSIDARYIEELENDFFALEDKHEAVLRERDELTTQLEAKVRTIGELQITLEQYREKVATLERRCIHLEEEIKGYRERLRLPESDQSHEPPPPPTEIATSEKRSESPGNASTPAGDVPCSGELQQRLNEVEQLCQEVMEENEQLKEEVEEMQREIEEMHDHFQEDDRDQMREMQRDLEAANKTCRILQFKLRKAERRYEQCEAERANLEERLARLEAELYSEADVAHIRNLEEEIRVAKEVGVRLNNELDVLDEKRAFYEEENRQLKEELETCQNQRILAQNDLGRLRLEVEKVKNEKGILDKGPLQVADKNRSRQTGSHPSLSRESSFEEQQLQRELEESRERETDLSEQLRFAEEELRKMKRRVKETQAENEILSKKMDRLFAAQAREPVQREQTSITSSQSDSGKEKGGNAPKLTNAQLENELVMTRRQLDLAEEENLGLRRKVLSYEREMNIAQNEVQRLQGRLPRSSATEMQELDSLRNQMALIQDHLARIEQERDRLASENHRLRTTDSSKEAEGLTVEELMRQNEALKERVKAWEKSLRELTREVGLVGSIERDHEWIDKYNDAKENIKELEKQLSRAKKRLAELQDENTKLRANERKEDQRLKRKQDKGTSSVHLSKDALVHEIKSLEEELDEVTADLTAAREQACTAQLRVTYLEDTSAESRAEAERRERELSAYIFHLENKNSVLNNLLKLVQERTETLQANLDRVSVTNMEASANSQLSSFSFVSAGSDEQTSDDQTETGEKKAMDSEQTGDRVSYLEKLLKEEKRRSELVETELERIRQDRAAPVTETDNQLKAKQIDILKKELEEKDESIETRDEQIADLRLRIEQSRKMNDALRALMEKEPGGGDKGVSNRMEATVEIASYRKEIESARKEMQILRNNLAQAEKVRERLIKDNRELQEELKLREDSIFDQDDELEKRNAELRALRVSMESLQKELEQTKKDLAATKSREAAGTSGRLSAQLAQTERIRNELHETTKQLNDMKVNYEAAKRALTAAEEKQSQLSNDLGQLKTTAQEKDATIGQLNKDLQKATDEMGQFKLLSQTAQTEKINLERQLGDAKKSLAAKEQECAALQLHLHETLNSLKQYEKQGSSVDSGIAESTTGRDGTLSRRSADVDRLRRELSLMRRERDDLMTELKKLRAKYEKQLAAEDQSKRNSEGGTLGIPTGNAYAKAVAAQQSTTKIALLNEHISSLNRMNVQLKLQNESLHNNVIDYQRRYRSLKEQYEGEQEAWLTERVVLESKAKELEDRKTAIANARKQLQETTDRLHEIETFGDKKYTKLQESYKKLEDEKNALEAKLNQIEEHQKLPKVLQRFGAPTQTGRSGMLGSQSRTTGGLELQETRRNLENAERTINKLRAEINDLKTAKQKEHTDAVQEAMNACQLAEQEAEDLRDRLLTMECYRQQAELFRHRQFEVEENAEKEFKIWHDERQHLILRAEEARTMVEQWCIQLQYRGHNDNERADDVVEDVYKQMEKWRASYGKVPCLKRRMADSLYSFESTSGVSAGAGSSVPASPAVGLARGGLIGSSTLSSMYGQTQRSTSMEWSNGPPASLFGHFRESSLGMSTLGTGLAAAGGLRGSAMSLGFGHTGGSGSNYSLIMVNRCGRSVSPEVTVRKLSNYPDPTPGFLVRPQSRQGSTDSLSSVGDYTQRSFTLPGKPPVRSAISPARRRFFEEDRTSQSPTSTKKPLHSPHAPLGKPPPDPSRSVQESTTKQSEDATQKEKSQAGAVTSAHVSKTSPIEETTKKIHHKSHGKKESADNDHEDSSSKSASKRKSGSTLSLSERFVKWSGSLSRHGSQTDLAGATTSSETKAKVTVTESPAKKTTKKAEDTQEKTKNKVEPPKPETESRPTRAQSSDVAAKPKPVTEPEPKKTEKTEKKEVTLAAAPQPYKRARSVSNISPAIAALRQKFAGGAK